MIKLSKSSKTLTELKLPTIAIDFDGVIHKYSEGWKDGTIYDKPVEGVKEALNKLSKEFRIVVYTTRERIGTPPEIGIEKDRKNVWWWLNKHDLSNYIYEVTNKKPLADFYIDDRAIRFSNWEEVLEAVKNYSLEQQPPARKNNPLQLKTNTPIANIENPLQAPAKHNLKALFEQLKFGRPKNDQDYLDECIGGVKKSNKVFGKLLFKSQMNLFAKTESHHEGETVQGKHGQLVVKKNSSGRGGHLEYLSKDSDERRVKSVEQQKPNKEKLLQKFRDNMGKIKTISQETAYNALSKLKDCKVSVLPKEAEEGMFKNDDEVLHGKIKTVNINSDGDMNIFMDTEGDEQIIKVPGNQAIFSGNERMLVKFVDRDVLIDLKADRTNKENLEDDSPIQMETVLNPYQIADIVISENKEMRIAEYPENVIVEIAEELVKVADDEYLSNKKFRNKLHGNNSRDALIELMEDMLPTILKDYSRPRSKEQVKTDNQLQIEIMQKAEIPEEDMVNYALSSVADGKILRTYISEVKSGEIDVDEAAKRVKNDYAKMKSGEKDGDYIKPEVKIIDATPKDYGPGKDKDNEVEKLGVLKGESTDQAIERYVGYQIENGRVSIAPYEYGWKATIGKRVIKAFKKEQLLAQIFREFYPDAKFERPSSTLETEFKKAV